MKFVIYEEFRLLLSDRNQHRFPIWNGKVCYDIVREQRATENTHYLINNSVAEKCSR